MEAGIHELTAGYALDALDPEERSAYEAHLSAASTASRSSRRSGRRPRRSPSPRRAPQPSPALRERILEEVRAEPPQIVVPFEPRRRRAVPVLAAAAAIAAVVALGDRALGVDPLEPARRDARRRSSASARPPQSSPIPTHDRSRCRRARVGSSSTPDGRGSARRSHGLDPAPTGKTYEMWIVPDGDIEQRIARGSSPGRDGREIVAVDGTGRAPVTSSP